MKHIQCLAPEERTPKIEKAIISNCKAIGHTIVLNDTLWDILMWNNEETEKFYKSFQRALEKGDIDTLKNALFNNGGIKNTIHVLLKKNDEKLEEFFWSNENALEQFNAMSYIR